MTDWKGGPHKQTEGYAEEMLRGISVDDDKYRFQLRNGDYRIFVQRHGQPWLVIEKGSKAIATMMMELDEARVKIKALEERIAGIW